MVDRSHDIEFDTVGWEEWERITCHSCKKTIVQQPWMFRQDWLNLKLQFLASHFIVRERK